jgi:hypothetical protein
MCFHFIPFIQIWKKNYISIGNIFTDNRMRSYLKWIFNTKPELKGGLSARLDWSFYVYGDFWLILRTFSLAVYCLNSTIQYFTILHSMLLDFSINRYYYVSYNHLRSAERESWFPFYIFYRMVSLSFNIQSFFSNRNKR